MTIYPLIIALILAVLDWIAAEKKWKRIENIAKPATMLALLGWLGSNVILSGEAIWFTLGLIFCLIGDVFLMIPRDMFIFGLLAFLVGHVFYLIGFNNVPPYFNLLGIGVLILLAVYMVWLFPKLVSGLKANGKTALKIPVLIYAVVISLMVYSAMMTWTRPGWPLAAALAASLGSLLFYASDSMLAWDRFVKPLPFARLKVLSTYHLGQIGIILGVILHLTQK